MPEPRRQHHVRSARAPASRFVLACNLRARTGLGIEKPDEWTGDDRDGHRGQVPAHLLLRAAHRARVSDRGVDDMAALVRAAMPTQGKGEESLRAAARST
ncbi:hypothetical protein [Streptomyces sp. NPDC016845]|uniref:hypothetical protein n=1 Tax=Streptomyces sp. NPDC016845 TaxID=3364972 RepID=UPI0037B8B129